MTHLDQAFTHLNRQFAKLRQKYVEFSNGIVRAIIEEEMKIRREEIDARVRAPRQRQQSPEA
ncbi:MAG: hypothetical protein WBS17_16750 [Candidatus Acidiferrales bacterium]